MSWKRDPLYRELYDYAEPHADVMRSWSIGGHINRFLMIPPHVIHRKTTQVDRDLCRVDGWVDTPRGILTFRDEIKRGINTYWNIEHLVETAEDLKKLAEIPFHFDPQDVDRYLADFHRQNQELGERGIMRIEYPSPIVAISATMKLENFLAMSVQENRLFHEILEEITRRLIAITDAIFAKGPLETIVNLGGSEQCTPPLMSPASFDEYVVPYDGAIVRRLKEYGILVNMHCHGKVHDALSRMIRIGVDSTDPIEPPPAGDVTYPEAREIAEDRLTLIGNLEFDELESHSPEHIRHRVRQILSLGKRRLILAASAGPVSAVPRRLVDNYKAWIDTCLEYYRA
jgi:uroporphyrinogen-III decarboxylase